MPYTGNLIEKTVSIFMKHILFLITLFIMSCSNQNNQKSQSYVSLISYQKYDFVNSLFLANSEVLLTIYSNGFVISKKGCSAIFFHSTNTTLPDFSQSKTISGEVDSLNPTDCWGARLDLEISKNGTIFEGRQTYLISILADSYNFVLE